MSTETPEIESPRQLLRYADPAELCEWGHTNRTLRHVPSAAAMPEDMLLPAYWVRCGNDGHISQNDIIRCIPADSAWFVELLVRDVGPEGVIVIALRSGIFDSTAAAPGASTHLGDEGADLYYAGPLLKWQVLGKDGKVWKSNLRSQEEAAVWLRAHREMQKRTTKGRT
jgi:hypothetical protein